MTTADVLLIGAEMSAQSQVNGSLFWSLGNPLISVGAFDMGVKLGMQWRQFRGR